MSVRTLLRNLVVVVGTVQDCLRLKKWKLSDARRLEVDASRD